LERLAREDWPRYVRLDAQQRKIAAVQQHVQAAQARQAQDAAMRWQSFVRDESAKFVEKAPEFADQKVAAAMVQQAGEMLRDLGFTPHELDVLWHGQGKVSLHDHRIQLLV